MSQTDNVKCSQCGAEYAPAEVGEHVFYCAKCGAVLSSPLGPSDSSAVHKGKRDIRKYAVVAIPFIVLIAWFGYLWFVSGVLPSVQKYDDGKPKELGYVKRFGLATYRRTGHWETYHPNGQKASEGEYKVGEKVPGTWKYWDAAGQPSDTPIGEESPAPSDR